MKRTQGSENLNREMTVSGAWQSEREGTYYGLSDEFMSASWQNAIETSINKPPPLMATPSPSSSYIQTLNDDPSTRSNRKHVKAEEKERVMVCVR